MLYTDSKVTNRTEQPNRTINYFRISVTDRCNLRCKYCLPEEGIRFLPHEEILSYEEILRLVRVSVQAGIRKVRVTGGEPLVRRGLDTFLSYLFKISKLEDISLTTNGVLLKPLAARLRKIGLRRINVSLDSLRPSRFRYITGHNCFSDVWEGIREAELVGFNPIKINVVAMRGINDDEIVEFARLAIDRPYHIRFIELMPTAENGSYPRLFLPMKDIFDLVTISLGKLKPIKSDSLAGPSKRYKLNHSKGEIGFISALSNHFCQNCNRLRLTSDGHLRGCLFSEDEIDIKAAMRGGKNNSELLELIKLAIKNKPKEHNLLYNQSNRKCVRIMSRVGG